MCDLIRSAHMRSDNQGQHNGLNVIITTRTFVICQFIDGCIYQVVIDHVNGHAAAAAKNKNCISGKAGYANMHFLIKKAARAKIQNDAVLKLFLLPMVSHQRIVFPGGF